MRRPPAGSIPAARGTLRPWPSPWNALNPSPSSGAESEDPRSPFPFQGRMGQGDIDGFPAGRGYPHENVPYDPPLGLFFAAVSFSVFTACKSTSARSPVKVALGASSTPWWPPEAPLEVVRPDGRKSFQAERPAFGYYLEDAMSGGNCGIQDQAAAVYGGVNRWIWCYGNPGFPPQEGAFARHQGQRSCLSESLSLQRKRHVSAPSTAPGSGIFLSGATGRAG